MSTPRIPLNSEIDALTEAGNIAKTIFHQRCTEIISDIISFSPDSYGDLMKLKTYMIKLADSQKEIDGIIYAAADINSLSDEVHLTEEEAIKKFEETVKEFITEHDIDEGQKDLLSSLDAVINEGQDEQKIEAEDNEVLVTKAVQNYKDPLTQRIMKDPVKSKICNHAYERQSIISYLGESMKLCPHLGCQSVIERKDLVEDFLLKFKLSMRREEI